MWLATARTQLDQIVILKKMKLSPKNPILNKVAAVSLIVGVLVTTLLILNGSEKRAQMNAEVVERGRGYGGEFQIINSIMSGLILSSIIFGVVTIIIFIKKKKGKV